MGAYVAAVFLGAALVFLVQPMVAKMVLPLFGGSPAVWTTSMVFFQAVLLAGYGYAHASSRLLGPRRQPLAQVGLLLLSLAALPVGRHLAAPPADASQALWLLGVLALAVGAPFFVVTTASPVLQSWFSQSGHPSARDPYFLYAAGNAGSLAALLAYPLVVEPNLSLTAQAWLWSGLYAGFAVASIACWALRGRGWTTRPADRGHAVAVSPAPSWRTRATWAFTAFVPSSLMLGATAFISTDVAAVPLLWVLPLSVYLLTFIVAFSPRPVVSVARASLLLPPATVLVALSLAGVVKPPIWALVLLHLAMLFLAGVLAHGRLAAQRPAADRLTDFYVMLSLGGALGGVFNALLAPRIFDSVAEYPLAIFLLLLLRPSRRSETAGRAGRLADALLPLTVFAAVIVGVSLVSSPSGARLVVAGIGAAVLLFARRPFRFALGLGALLLVFVWAQSGIYAERTFFGVLRVVQHEDQHQLFHGTTLHGIESFAPGRLDEPLSYYTRSGPIGDVFSVLQERNTFSQVDVIGLGAGSLAAYGRPGQTFTFYELDPAVVRIASNPRFFTFLRDSKARVRIVVGDGRRTLAAAPRSSADLVVIDAFSSDSVPVHLLTREAVQLYLDKVRTGGVIAFHVSNRHLDLAPVVADVARDLRLVAAERREVRVSDRLRRRGKDPSDWIVLAQDPRRLTPLLGHGWKRLVPDGSRVWTDDFSNILAVIDWS